MLLPLLFKPMEYDNKCWIDGGVINNFPIDYCNDQINNTLGIAIKDICLKLHHKSKKRFTRLSF